MINEQRFGDEYNLVYLQKNGEQVIGSYFVKNQDDVLIAKSIGYTISRRSILCTFFESELNYEVIKRSKGYFLILNEGEIVGSFKLALSRLNIELRIHDHIYMFYSKNFGKTYKIRRNGNDVGIINSSNWLEENIHIAILKDENLEKIVLVVLGVAYDVCSSPFRFFK